MGIEEFILRQKLKQEGIEEGISQRRSKKTTEFIDALLTETSFSVEEIARQVGVARILLRRSKA